MTCLRATGGAKSLSRRPADGSRVRHVLAPPAPVPVWADARPAPERFARLRRLSLALLLSALPVTDAGGASFRVRVWAFSAMRG